MPQRALGMKFCRLPIGFRGARGRHDPCSKRRVCPALPRQFRPSGFCWRQNHREIRRCFHGLLPTMPLRFRRLAQKRHLTRYPLRWFLRRYCLRWKMHIALYLNKNRRYHRPPDNQSSIHQFKVVFNIPANTYQGLWIYAIPVWLFGAVCKPRQDVLAAQDRATSIDRGFIQHFFDPDQLVVFCQAI